MLLIGFLCPSGSVHALDLADMRALLETHGAAVLVQVVMDVGDGQVSIERNGRIERVWGRPRVDWVTARSLLADARRAKLDRPALEQRLSMLAEGDATDSAATPAKSAIIPLANLDPELRVWSPARMWTVSALVEDAERHPDGMDEARGAQRMRAAFRRNAALERVLLGWEARYGTMEMREVEKILLRQARDRLYACRRIKKRTEPRAWREGDCDRATRPGATRVRKPLQATLRRIFEAYRAALVR